MTAPNLKRARIAYRVIRDCWVAEGGALEAHDRLAAITVAAGMREFALLNHLDSAEYSAVVERLRSVGLGADVCSSEFDFEIDPDGISRITVEAYLAVERARNPLKGVGIWSQVGQRVECAAMSSLGQALSYPDCCERMDLRTKFRDHELFLSAIVEEEGDDAGRVQRALQEHREYAKACYDHCSEWNERFTQTFSLYPFVLHTACDDCLHDDESPSAALNRDYEQLAASVSAELHLMVRWGAKALIRSSR